MTTATLNIYTLGICGIVSETNPQNRETWHVVLPQHQDHEEFICIGECSNWDPYTVGLLETLNLEPDTQSILTAHPIEGRRVIIETEDWTPTQAAQDNPADPFPPNFNGRGHNWPISRVANLESLVGEAHSTISRAHLVPANTNHVSSIMKLEDAEARTYTFSQATKDDVLKSTSVKFEDRQGQTILNRAIGAIVHLKCKVNFGSDQKMTVRLENFSGGGIEELKIPKVQGEYFLIIGNLSAPTVDETDHFLAFYNLCTNPPSHGPCPLEGNHKVDRHVISQARVHNFLRMNPRTQFAKARSKQAIRPRPNPPDNWVSCPPARYSGIA